MTLQTDLQKFTGTLAYHKLTLFPVLATDGVLYLAKKGGAFWLVDDISAIYTKKKNKYPFMVIKAISQDNKATVKYTDGNYKKIFTQEYNYTDLPEGEYKLYLVDGVLMLPSEY